MLRENEDLRETGIDTVRQRDVNEEIDAANPRDFIRVERLRQQIITAQIEHLGPKPSAE